LLLAVMARLEDDPDELDRLAAVLESYLVRRMICSYQTRGYGTLALKLHALLSAAPDDAPMAELLRNQLLSETGSDSWPDDEMFRGQWLQRRFYGTLRRDRVLMLLKALEQKYQSSAHLAEPLMSFDWSQLQIEHILPQAWQSHWPLPDHVTADERNWFLQGIGNLTLVSGKLNPVLSNAPWRSLNGEPCKRDELHKHTRLEVNRRLLDAHEEWSDDAIRTRAENLYADAQSIWCR
jgi:hypothetical protein